MAWPGVRSRVA